MKNKTIILEKVKILKKTIIYYQNQKSQQNYKKRI